MSERESIKPTYDSSETGPRFTLSTFVNGRSVDWEEPLIDPFVTTEMRISWRDALRGLLRGGLKVRFQVSGDRDIIEDVLELDNDYIGVGSSRRREWHTSLFTGQTVGDSGDGDD